MIVAYAVDRLSRSQNHIGLLFDEFERAEARLEGAVVRELTTVLASPEVVLAELERTSARDGADRDLVSARELLASLDKQRQRLLRLFQLGEVDEAYLQKELAAIQNGARAAGGDGTTAAT